MGGRRLVRRAAAAAVLAAAAVAPSWLASPGPASAADLVNVVTVRSMYVPGDDELGSPVPTLHVQQGGSVTLTNLDSFAAHSLSSDEITPSGERRFDTGALNFRASAPAAGVASLPPGSYPFHCTIHEDNMRGVLVVH